MKSTQENKTFDTCHCFFSSLAGTFLSSFLTVCNLIFRFPSGKRGKERAPCIGAIQVVKVHLKKTTSSSVFFQANSIPLSHKPPNCSWHDIDSSAGVISWLPLQNQIHHNLSPRSRAEVPAAGNPVIADPQGNAKATEDAPWAQGKAVHSRRVRRTFEGFLG